MQVDNLFYTNVGHVYCTNVEHNSRARILATLSVRFPCLCRHSLEPLLGCGLSLPWCFQQNGALLFLHREDQDV